jgi:hypothetical protein
MSKRILVVEDQPDNRQDDERGQSATRFAPAQSRLAPKYSLAAC